MDETKHDRSVTPLLRWASADADVCADGFCAVPPPRRGPGPEQAGAGE